MTPPSLPTLASTSLASFADWLNPMLVKELRQGLRHKVFIGAFMIIQVSMLLFVGLQLLGDADAGVAETLDSVLWSVLGIVLLMMMPLRGLTAINEEKKGNTLELVQVTRLDSFRIVFGKWVSIGALTLLLVVSVLPYAVLRYFFGGVDVFEQVIRLGMMMLGSLTITAGSLWLSTMGPVGRALGVIGAIVVMEVSMMSVTFSTMGGPVRSPWGSFGTWGAASLLIGGVFNTAFFLALAASRIAAASENHAVIIRGIALLAGVVGVGFAVVSSPAVLMALMPLMVWSIFEAMTELTSEFPALYRPWAMRGWLGRMAGRVLNPGWATGLIHSALIIFLLVGASALQQTIGGSTRATYAGLTWVLVYLSALMPVPVLLMLPRVKQRGILYLVVLLFGLGVFVLARVVDDSVGRSGGAFIDALTPVSACVWAFSNSSKLSADQWPLFIAITLPIGGVLLLGLMIKSVAEFRKMRVLERRSIQPEDEA